MGKQWVMMGKMGITDKKIRGVPWCAPTPLVSYNWGKLQGSTMKNWGG